MLVACALRSLNWCFLSPRSEVLTLSQRPRYLHCCKRCRIDFFLSIGYAADSFPETLHQHVTVYSVLVDLIWWSLVCISGCCCLIQSTRFLFLYFSASGVQLLNSTEMHRWHFYVCLDIYLYLFPLIGYWGGRGESWWNSSGFRKYHEENSKKKQQRYRAVREDLHPVPFEFSTNFYSWNGTLLIFLLKSAFPFGKVLGLILALLLNVLQS